jgi:hypothetical protein
MITEEVLDSYIKAMFVKNTPVARDLLASVDEFVLRVRQAAVAELNDRLAKVHTAAARKELQDLMDLVTTSSEMVSITPTRKSLGELSKSISWIPLGFAYCDNTDNPTPAALSIFPSEFSAAILQTIAAAGKSLLVNSWPDYSIEIEVWLNRVSENDVRIYCTASVLRRASDNSWTWRFDPVIGTTGDYRLHTSQKIISTTDNNLLTALAGFSWTITDPTELVATTYTGVTIQFRVLRNARLFRAKAEAYNAAYNSNISTAAYEKISGDDIPLNLSGINSLLSMFE